MQGVDKFMALHAFPIMPGMRELVVKLLTSGKQVFLVSGGFRRIYANNIMFDEEGKYAGFDGTEPTSRSGGKAEAVKGIKASNGFQTVAMVGDGMTDLEARVEGGADAFICFTGVVRREPRWRKVRTWLLARWRKSWICCCDSTSSSSFHDKCSFVHSSQIKLFFTTLPS